MEELTKQDVIDFIKEVGLNLFGDHAEIIAKVIAQEVLDEYNDAGDGDLQKAVSYVVWDKFNGMVEPK